MTHQRYEAEMALADGQAQLQSRAYTAAARTLNRGVLVAEGLPMSSLLLDRLSGQLRLAQRAQAAQQLHTITESLRFLYGIEPPDARQAAKVAAQCQRIWDTRDRIAQTAGCELEAGLEKQIQQDLLDLVILWADLHARLAPAEGADEARQDALRLLGEAESHFGPSIVLARECQEYAEALGRRDVAQAAERRVAELVPRTAWEHYSLGRFFLRSGNPTRAMLEFERALELRPQDFWPNFYQGSCAYLLRRYEEATHAFRVCLALAPDCAECFYNRGLAEAALGRTDRALHDYNRALELNPALAAAALNRGILHFQAKRYQEALDDFQWALDQGADGTTIHYNMALVYWARKDRGAALGSLRRVLETDRQHNEARELYDRLVREP
jgi:tetratricopeptide (TPR) repeat protein